MSTLQATNLKNASSASNNIVLDTAGNATVAGTMAMGSSYLRNRIINGDMRIDQRNAGASVSVSGDYASYYGVDRFAGTKVTSGVFSVQRTTTAPPGFTNSLKATVTTADASLAAGDFANITQPIEGFNIADLGFGAAGASSVTLSFWVRSNLTGTYCSVICNGTGTRSYVSNYTINSANTWEQKVITIPGDTTGTWATDNTSGFLVRFGLMAGSNWQQAAGSWGTGNVFGSSSQVNWMATLNNDFYLTGVQLEPGTVATPFERRQYGQELALCQRYCYRQTGNKYGDGAYYISTECYPTVFYPVTMRAAPTFSVSSQTGITVFSNGSGRASTAVASNNISTSTGEIKVTTSAATAGNGAAVFAAGVSDWIQFSAEL